MMRIGLLPAAVAAVFLAGACVMDNDMMLPKDVAGYETFEIEGQVSASINTSKLTVTVTMPYETDLKSLTVKTVKYTDATRGKEALMAAGDLVDLSDTMYVRLMAYRLYEWKLIAVNASEDTSAAEEVQLYNMSFDNWCQTDLSGKSSKGWFPYLADDDDADKAVWTTSNKSTSDLLGRNTTTPEESFLAVSGTGKKAAKLSSDYIIIKFAAGNLFTGEFCGLIGTKGADLAWGIPFTSRPKSLHGYYCYQPVAIDNVQSPYEDMLGKTDVGQIQIILADWDPDDPYEGYPEDAIDDEGRFHVINSSEQFVDFENDPAIIGYANYEFNSWMDSYEEFDLPIEYRSDRTPKVVVIVAASSRYGDYFTGGDGTVLYLDEFSFTY